MKKIRIILSSEYGLEVKKTISTFWINRTLFRKKFLYSLRNEKISFIQYLFFIEFDPHAFLKFDLSFQKFSSNIKFEFNTEKFVYLANTYKDIYSFKWKEYIDDFQPIIESFINQKDTFSKKSLLESEEYLEYLFYIYIWTSRKQIGENIVINYVYPRKYKLTEKSLTYKKVPIHSMLLKYLWPILQDWKFEEIIIIWSNTLNKASYKALQLYCDSHWIGVILLDIGDVWLNDFTKKIFITSEFLYKDKYKDQIKYNDYCIITV